MPAKCALVTGGARRIGRAISEHLASEGWDIALHYLSSADEAEATRARVEALGRTCRLYQADMRDPAAIKQLVADVFRDFAQPRLLINSASIFKRDRVADLDVDVWNEHLVINTLAPTLLARDFIAHAPVDGCVINFLDQKVSYPTPDFFSYTISKTALGTITRLLAMEYHGRCRVNGIAPGLTLPSGDQSLDDFRRVYADTPLRVGPTVDDLCRAVSFLADTPSISGQIITIDGGRHLLKPAAPFDDLPKK